MKNIGKWLLIAETAEKMCRTENSSRYASVVLELACGALADAGYPCRNNNSAYLIELNGKDLTVAKTESAQNETKEFLWKENERLSRENKLLSDDIKRMKKMLIAILDTEEETGEKPEETSEPVEEEYPELEEVEELIQENETFKQEKEADEKSVESEDAVTEQETKKQEEESAELEPVAETENEPEPDKEYDRTDSVPEESDKRNEPEVQDIMPVVNDDIMSGYKMPLDKKELALSYQTLEIRQDSSSVTTTAEIVLSPLSMKEGESDIIAWVNDSINREVRMSQRGRKTVLVHVGSVPLIVGGRVENGRFRGTVTTTRKMEEAGVSVEATETTLDGRGHVLLEDDGIAVRIVPISDDNRANGDAEFIYAVLEEGEEPVMGDNISGRAHFNFRGTENRIIARWKDGTFYATVKPV